MIDWLIILGRLKPTLTGFYCMYFWTYALPSNFSLRPKLSVLLFFINDLHSKKYHLELWVKVLVILTRCSWWTGYLSNGIKEMGNLRHVILDVIFFKASSHFPSVDIEIMLNFRKKINCTHISQTDTWSQINFKYWFTVT